MCTVSWVRETTDGYTLCVSRDENRARQFSSAPAARRADGVKFLAPVDGQRGGSWVAVNELGVSVCLLNRCHPSPREDWLGPSRGDVVMRLASSCSRDDAARRLMAWDLSIYRPFTVACLEPGRPALVIDWTGTALRGDFEADERCPLASSSKSPDLACTARRELFERFRAGGLTHDALVEFHRSHDPQRGALSPCMHRDDAATVSFTAVTVASAEVRMSYQHGAPCEDGPVCSRSLPRSAGRDARAA